MSSEFKREERYVVIKIKDLEFNSPSGDKNKRSKELGEWISRNSIRTRECVVVESDWPEYHLVWAMIEHRMAGKPVPNFNDWRRADELQQRLTVADERADVLETALAGMLFAFDDGVGRDWSEGLLDFARKLTSAKEFKAALKPADGTKCKACGGSGSVCVDWDSGAWADCQKCTKS